MTPLAHRLVQMIRAEGPISIARFMTEALLHPRYGYYVRSDPLGRDGDFITAPEVSQMFGEMVGLWCADGWASMGCPETVQLVELGPGRGTLMADAWRATAVQPGFRDAARVHLVEVSPALRDRQASTLAQLSPPVRPTWHHRFAEVPEGPVLVVANELFDALPIHQHQRTLEGWRERLVDVALDGHSFRFVLAPASVDSGAIPPPVRDAPLQSVSENSPAAIALAVEIAERSVRCGGGALLIDYGASETRPRDTLQAVRRHDRHPVLKAPGTADICAHVDFAALAKAARAAGARVHGPIGQGRFLRALGIDARCARLKAGASAAQRGAIDSAYERLTDGARMGELFKVLAITDPALPPPAGFEERPSEVRA